MLHWNKNCMNSNKVQFLYCVDGSQRNIEIVGIEQLPEENLRAVVNKLGEMIKVSTTEIEWIKRNQPRKQDSNPGSIIVGFKTSGIDSRDAWRKAS